MSTTLLNTNNTRKESIIKLKSILNIIGCEDDFYDNISTTISGTKNTITSTNNKNIEYKLIELKKFYLPKIISILNNSKDKGYNESNFYFHKYNFNWKFNIDNNDNDLNKTFFNNIRTFLHYLKDNNVINNNILFKIIDKDDDNFKKNKNINILFSNILDS